jgi:[ribosomal protein S5]-alanine N-acetyltransferase
VIELRPMTPEFIEALLDGRREDAAALLKIEVPEEFPSEGERGFLTLRLRQMHENIRFQVWCPHAIVLGGQMIGHAGYHGPPGINSLHAPEAVEFGYRIFPPYRGRGYATEAARMLMDLAEQRADIRHFVLSVGPTNEPSLAIVRKLGFIHVGERMDDEEGRELVFELRRDGGAP